MGVHICSFTMLLWLQRLVVMSTRATVVTIAVHKHESIALRMLWKSNPAIHSVFTLLHNDSN